MASDASVSRPEATDTVDSLILDLLEWIGPTSRTYTETLDAWRTSCPRLPVWEEATDRGFISLRSATEGGSLVCLSAAGTQHLRTHRQLSTRQTPAAVSNPPAVAPQKATTL